MEYITLKHSDFRKLLKLAKKNGLKNDELEGMSSSFTVTAVNEAKKIKMNKLKKLKGLKNK